MLLLAAVTTGLVDWSEVGRWLKPRVVMAALTASGVMMLAVGMAEAVRGRQRRSGRPPRPPLSLWAIAAGAVLVAAVAYGATAWLLAEAERAQDPAAARVEAVKTGLGIGAGTGGILALLLAVRRQWHQEVTAVDATHDATERRLTELYTKAVEQLGAEKAPVRLGGLYALERLAQDNATQRQTIVNVLCAYLRMPYETPGEPPATNAQKDLITEYRERIQEQEVRLTAQRLLSDHLRPGKDPASPAVTFWNDIDVDLTGATLIDLNLEGTRIRSATFREGNFVGDAKFENATFVTTAWFGNATFTGDVWFHGATFIQNAGFRRTHFEQTAMFYSTTFGGNAGFEEAHFDNFALFQYTTFIGPTWFQGATFAQEPILVRSQFKDRVPPELAVSDDTGN